VISLAESVLTLVSCSDKYLCEIIDLLINFKEFLCIGKNGHKTSYNHKNNHKFDMKIVADRLVNCALKYAVSGFRFSRGKGGGWGGWGGEIMVLENNCYKKRRMSVLYFNKCQKSI